MQALDNKNINPDGGDDCFAVSVLKALFLVKYVKEFQKATVTNLTTLLISDMDEDRLDPEGAGRAGRADPRNACAEKR